MSLVNVTNCSYAEEIAPTDLIEIENITNSTGTSYLDPSSLATSSQLRSSTNQTPNNRPSTQPSQANGTPRGLSHNDRIIAGTTISIVAIILAIISLLAWRKVRRSRRVAAAHANADTNSPGGDAQPYLQQKAELDDEQRRHELGIEETRNEPDDSGEVQELEGEDSRHEILTEVPHVIPSLLERHELRGEEHSKELDVP